MKLIEKIKKWLNIEKFENNSSQQVETNNLSIIDISNLEIDRNLTKEENESRKRLFEEISSGNFSTFITYGNDIAKQINYYMDIVRKRLNQNIEQNQSISRNVSLEQAIRQKVQIIFNNAEIDSILDDLNKLRRNCELRIIALEDLGNIELKKSKKKIFFFGEKTDESKIASINNTISRISAQINILNMLTTSIKNEQAIYMNENYSLDEFINSNNSKEANKIANRVLSETFEEVKRAITSISTFSSIQSLVIDDIPIDKIDIDEMPLDKKVEIIALSKRYLDFYVAQNREKLLSKGGLLDRADNYQNQLWEEIESDYLDVPLWAKKAFPDKYIFYKGKSFPDIINKAEYKYRARLDNIESLITVFREEIPEDYIEKFYKTKFYFYALYFETVRFDSHKSKPININSEEERKCYLKFISQIVEKMHKESDDGELLKFMDKHLSLRNPDAILNQYDKLVALLRIEKFGRDGLFTLMLYTADFQDNSLCYCCLDQINPKYLQETNLQVYEFNPSQLAKDILKLWKTSKSGIEEYNAFWGDYNDGWEFVKEVKDGLYPRSNPSNYTVDYLPDYSYFLINTIKDYNLEKRKENPNTPLRERFNTFFSVKMHYGQYVAMFSYLIQDFSKGEIKKEEVAETIKNLLWNNYKDLTRIVLEKYLNRNLSNLDFEHFDNYFTKAYHESYLSISCIMYNIKHKTSNQRGEKFEDYKFVVETYKKFEELGLNGRVFTDICLLLDKGIGKEIVRDELLTDYTFSKNGNKLILRNNANNIGKIIESHVYNAVLLEEEILEFYLLNKLLDKEIMADETLRRTAVILAHYYMKYYLSEEMEEEYQIYNDVQYSHISHERQNINIENFRDLVTTEDVERWFAGYIDVNLIDSTNRYHIFDICRYLNLQKPIWNTKRMLSPNFVREIASKKFESKFDLSFMEKKYFNMELPRYEKKGDDRGEEK